MICSNCGTENPPGAKFCNECATALAGACPRCGTINAPRAKFCSECATPLLAGPFATATAGGDSGGTSGAAGAAPPASSAADHPGQRRLVTVVFADLVGFTPFAEERDAEEVRDTLTRYFDLATEVMTRYGGTVEKFIGDAVMAVWGVPSAREDDAERAVRAALDLLDAIPVLGPAIKARAAVMTGEAAVTLGATNQGMVAGDLVNTASRLQAAAPVGCVFVDEATQRAAASGIFFEPAGQHELKGKSAPLAAWRAVRVIAEVGGRNRRDTLEAPFVGRAEEFRLLKDLFHATVRERRPRLVSVIGPAGIGKSRLAWELLKYLDGLLDTVWWHDGRSPAYGQGVTFWALGEMVRARCGLLENDDEATTREKVAATLAQHVPDPDERSWIEPALLALLGVSGRPPGWEELFSAWRTFFERLAASAPVVMVFEDCHYADAGLLAFVDHLLEWARTAPIYVVTLARPELLERRPDWGAGTRSFTSVRLEPLGEADMRELLAGLVPGLPEAAVRVIVGRADGVPLYAVETVRMLVAEGRLATDGGTYRPVGDFTRLAVPETLTALIASRLDALPAADRALVSDAAVLGQSFTRAALSAVSGISEASLEAPLRGLIRRELLTLEADPRSPERGQYVFVQALIREVAYNSLLKRDRKSRHLAAARYFEGLGSEELAGALAGHYLAAYEQSTPGPESDALAGQARIALRAAGDRAAMLGAHAQAVAFFEQALSVTPDPVSQADLLEQAAESHTAMEGFDEAEAALRGALERREAAGDRAALARTTAALGSALLSGYRFEQGLALLEQASHQFPDLVGEPALAIFEAQLARAYFLHDDPHPAIATSDRVLAAAELLDLVDVIADTLVTRGSALASIGRRYEGIGAIEAGHQLAVANGFQWTVGRALNNLASFLMASDPRAALAAARAGIAHSRRLGRRSFNLLDNAFTGAMRTGEWDWATAELQAALAEEGDSVTRRIAITDLITIRAARVEPTTDLLAELDALPTGELGAVHEAMLAWSRAAIAFAAGDFELAQSGYRSFAALFPMGVDEGSLLAARAALWARDPGGAREDLLSAGRAGRRGRVIDADRITMRAGIAALEGHPTEARTLYRDALIAWRELGLPWDEALCLIDMAAFLDPAEPDIRSAVERARELLTPLRAKPFLDRLDSGTSRAPRRPLVADVHAGVAQPT